MEVLKPAKNRFVLFFVGFLIALSAWGLQIPYVVVFLLGILGLCICYGQDFLALLIAIFSYTLLPDVLSLAFLFGMFFIYLGKKFFEKDLPFRVYSHELPYYFYLLIMIVGAVTSIMLRGSLRDLAIHFGGFGMMLYILDQMESEERFHKMVVVLVFVTTILALLGIYQYVTGAEIKREWVDTANNAGLHTRAYSIFGNPNIFAEFLVMVTPLTVALFWETKRDGKKTFYIVLFLLQVIALLMTMSRGGWVGLAVAALVFVFFINKRLLLFGIPIMAGGALLLPSSVLSRFLTIFNFADSSTSYRFKIWEITEQVIHDHFLVGVGLGHQPFKYVFETYIRTMPIFHAHNTYLEIFAELGLVGFLVFIFFIFSLWGMGVHYLVGSRSRFRKIFGSALLASMAGLLVHGMFENILYLTKITTTFWILTAFIYGLIRLEKKDRKEIREREHGQEINRKRRSSHEQASLI